MNQRLQKRTTSHTNTLPKKIYQDRGSRSSATASYNRKTAEASREAGDASQAPPQALSSRNIPATVSPTITSIKAT